MVQQKIEQPEHRNSLGYVISQRGFGMAPEEAMIVWGNKPDGTRLFIDQARRGAADHLKCECGAELIARKGDVRAHHFAHASGAAQNCTEAHLKALSKFAADALERFRKVRIPQIPGKPQTTTFAEAKPEVFGAFGGVRIARGTDHDRRELCILFKVKRGRAPHLKETFAMVGVSAMVVDLSPFRNLPDERVANAVAFEAERSWLHNTRHPEAETSQAKDAITRANSSRRTRKREWGSPSPAQLPRIEKTVTADQSRADADSDRTEPKVSISREEWDTLSPAELRRRLFGSEYGD
ncbi:hypothetical protein GCM10011494_39350 [Novosphingobium endophyticum]|uniref:Uncharacterized protein n=1 Tax=Novosphingobium endophyticum TaxID=1955250 RepID=A0A916TVU0_9SPHN|nr:hypothetical protein [Novosphingobium endophyticum]GGC16586.1 hypothetical protein GCM10011494_39350 [Novosphingobium endophyticum]